MTREQIFSILNCSTYSSYHTYDNILFGYDLQFFTKEKGYIYGYSLIYRGESEFPMYGIKNNGFYIDSQVCIINNINELRKFGQCVINGDDSIFTKKFDIEKTKITDDKLLNQMVRKDKTILNMLYSYSNGYTYILRIK